LACALRLSPLNTSHGNEWRFGYSIDVDAGRWHFRPSWTAARRSANLNDYYYGVRPVEATPWRAAYMPGAGTDWTMALYGYYELTRRWRLLGGVGVTYLNPGVRASPLVADKPQVGALVGAAYDFGSHAAYGQAGTPPHVKVLGGRATECNFVPAMALRCGSTRTGDDTRIWGVDVGRTLVEHVNGWPLDFAGYVGVLAHDERGIRSNGLQLDAQIKAYYDGLPWSDTPDRLRRRLLAGPARAGGRSARPVAPRPFHQPASSTTSIPRSTPASATCSATAA
jgi:outer membrane protein